MDFIINIPGPLFLLVYAIYSILVIVIAKRVTLIDYTNNMEIPETTEFEPMELAYLKKGTKGVIITSIFNLWRQKLIDIKKNKSFISLSRITDEKPRLNEIDGTLFNFMCKERYYRKLFTQNSIKTIEELFVLNKNRLKNYKLLADEVIQSRNRRVMINTILLLLAFGGIKLYFGLIRNKPFLFLIVLMILFTFLAWILLNPDNVKTSSLGRKLIKQSEQRFDWLKESHNSSELLTNDNLLFGIALFGVKSFLNTNVGKLLDSPKFIEQSGRFGSVIGSGTSDNSGCSGCSGGCGGGCGGCGGGCGGCGGD